MQYSAQDHVYFNSVAKREEVVTHKAVNWLDHPGNLLERIKLCEVKSVLLKSFFNVLKIRQIHETAECRVHAPHVHHRCINSLILVDVLGIPTFWCL